MRIAILSSYPVYPFRQQLGIPNAPVSHPYSWVKNLATHLAKIDGNEVHVLTMRRDVPNDASVVDGNVTFHFLKGPNKIAQVATFSQAGLMKMRRRLHELKCDIVHGQGTDRYSYFAVKSRLPNVITVHGIMRDFQKSLGAQTSRKNVLMNLYMEKACFTSARDIISISPFVNQYIELYESKARIHTIENAVSGLFFQQQQFNEENDILYVGSITPRKRFIDLLKALVLLPEMVRLRVISFITTPPSYGVEVEQFIHEHQLSGRVSFIGHRDEAGVALEIARSKVVVLPSGAETAPMVIAEAMAVGKPVVASNAGGIRSMIVDGQTGFVHEIGDISALACRMEAVLNDAALRKAMGERARAIAAERFHPDRVAAKTFETYQSILNK